MNVQGKIATDPSVENSAEHIDVIVVGAGISGIGAAYHLTKQNPDTRFLVLETQDSFGGTWHTHRYPASAPTVTCIRSAIASSPGHRRPSPPLRKSCAIWGT
jgi:cation diffusion facilitator CzcD-associated flavoprotein CzcO